MKDVETRLAEIAAQMEELSKNPDTEVAHGEADDLLELALETLARHASASRITSVQRIVQAFKKVPKWYA